MEIKYKNSPFGFYPPLWLGAGPALGSPLPLGEAELGGSFPEISVDGLFMVAGKEPVGPTVPWCQSTEMDRSALLATALVLPKGLWCS